MQKLIIFGDSILKGVMKAEHGYHLCSGHNFDAISQQGISVISHAKMGATVETGLAAVRKMLPPCDSETTVLLDFGGNDCNHDWSVVANEPDKDHLPATSPDRFVSLYEELIRTVQVSGAKVAVASLVPLDADRFFQTISQAKDASAILRWLGDKYHLYRWQERYNVLVCRLARAMDCTLVDLRTPFLENADFPSLIGSDGIHPTQAGHDLIHSVVRDSLI